MKESHMFFPVKVYDGKGNLKRTIKVKSLVTRHWKRFQEKAEGVIDYTVESSEACPDEFKKHGNNS